MRTLSLPMLAMAMAVLAGACSVRTHTVERERPAPTTVTSAQPATVVYSEPARPSTVYVTR